MKYPLFDPSLMKSMDNLVREVSTNMAKAQDQMILQQLNEFISRGLIEVRVTQPMLVRDQDSTVIKLSQAVQLVLKDQEYIENLEKENQKLKSLMLLTDPVVSNIVMNPLTQTQWLEFERFQKEELNGSFLERADREIEKRLKAKEDSE